MYPIIILSITGLITLFLGFLKNKQLLMPATLVFIAIAFISNFCDWNKPGLYFNEMLSSNNISILFTGIILISAFCIVGMSRGFQNDHYGHGAEYYAIMQFSLVGAIMMTNYQNIIMLFLGVEIMSVSLYILTGSDKHNLRGNEAAIKYFLMGAFATGIMLFGMAMLYGAIGSFDIGDASAMIAQFPESNRPIY